MKTIGLITLLFFMSVGVFAQNDFDIKPLPKIDFNDGFLQQDNSYLEFENDRESADYLVLLSTRKVRKEDFIVMKYKNKMPIAKPQGNYWNMPIAVPDSTINYAIMVKRIGSGSLFKGQK